MRDRRYELRKFKQSKSRQELIPNIGHIIFKCFLIEVSCNVREWNDYLQPKLDRHRIVPNFMNRSQATVSWFFLFH